MENTKLTEKEMMVLKAIMADSNFNSDSLDITKTWEEQHIEGENYYAFPDTKDYGCGMPTPVVKGVFGSLVKKGMIDILPDVWLIISEWNFNNIKKALG